MKLPRGCNRLVTSAPKWSQSLHLHWVAITALACCYVCNFEGQLLTTPRGRPCVLASLQARRPLGRAWSPPVVTPSRSPVCVGLLAGLAPWFFVSRPGSHPGLHAVPCLAPPRALHACPHYVLCCYLSRMPPPACHAPGRPGCRFSSLTRKRYKVKLPRGCNRLVTSAPKWSQSLHLHWVAITALACCYVCNFEGQLLTTPRGRPCVLASLQARRPLGRAWSPPVVTPSRSPVCVGLLAGLAPWFFVYGAIGALESHSHPASQALFVNFILLLESINASLFCCHSRPCR